MILLQTKINIETLSQNDIYKPHIQIFKLNFKRNFPSIISKPPMKKPFANIGKLKKQKPLQSQANQQKKFQAQNIMQRPPTGKLKLNVDKPKTNIYDALRKIDDEKQQVAGSVHKPSLGFKKNKILKGDKNEAPNLGLDNNRGNQAVELEQSQENVAVSNNPRPTPLFNRNKGKLLLGKSKQKPVVEQEPEQPTINANRNRMAYVNDEQQPEQTEQLPLNEEPSKKLIKPNLFKGVGDRKISKPLNNSPSGPQKPQQRIPNNSQVYHEYTQPQKKEKFNFQTMMNVEKAEINIQRKIQQVSLDKIQKQAKRSRELSQLLNLQMDLYEPLVSISSTTPFQVYISKIKAGFLKNSCDQAFDQKNDVQCQTLSFEYVDFCNQCPQDYQLGHGFYQSSAQSQFSQESISDMILALAPVIQQLIKPSRQVIMPPTSLLAFSPSFKKFLKCPNPTFVYYSQPFNYSLVAIGQKIYICEEEIQCALDLGGSKLAGLKNGKIVLWNGQNDRASHSYATIREMIQSQNFQLPVCVTNDFDKLSPYLCEGSIVALIGSEEKNSFYSFDSTAKLVKWSIQKINRKTTLVPKELNEFSNILEKKHMVGLGLKKRNQTFYLWTSSGIICWDKKSVQQKLQAFGIRDFFLPKRSNLVFCLSQFSTIQIFSTQYHQLLQQVAITTNQTLQQLIIPQLEHQNRQISIFYNIYAVSDAGSIYEVRFGDRQVDWKKVSGKPSDQQDGGKSKRSANVIYQGVNVLGEKVEKIKLFRDLKCTTETQNLGIDLSPTVNNIKTIIIKNKEFLSLLTERNVCLV